MQRPEIRPVGQSPEKPVPASPANGLPLRRDEVVSGAFLLQTTIVLAILLGGSTLVLKWLAKRMQGKSSVGNETRAPRRIRVLERLSVSAKTRITLLDVDGRPAIITESAQSSVLQFVPSAASPGDGGHDGAPAGEAIR